MNQDLSTDVKALQLSKVNDLPRDLQLKMAASLIGYKTMPVDIETFITDDYYLGKLTKNLYPFWFEWLKKLYPDPIFNPFPFIVFTGCIGSGKSTVSRIIFEYLRYKVSCLKNPYDTFHLIPGKHFKFSFFHKTSILAWTDMIDVMNKWEEESPYFVEANKAGKLDIFEMVGDTIRSNANIGSDCLGYIFSELNFVPAERAKAKINDATKRFGSRFELFMNYFGSIIIDSSSQNDDSIVDEFIANNPFGDKVKVIYTNRWIVKAHMNYYGKHGWFKVFCGDSTHSPFIVNEKNGQIVTSDMDEDRVIDVPMELLSDFKFDLETSLQDIAGISVSASDKFFRDTTKWKECFDLPSFHPDVVKFDYYDKTDKLIYRFDRSIRTIPRDKIIFIRYDIGVTGDNTGLAISYFDKWKIYDGTTKMPIIIVPLAVGINRYDGQETPISHLEEFIYDLNDNFEIGDFSADQFASRQLLQDLTMRRIPNRYLSVDRTDEAAIYVKSLASRGLLHIEDNKLLMKEGCELRRVGLNKVDHPASGSKDIFDAVDGCVFDLYQNLDLAGQLSNKYKAKQYNQSIEQRRLETDNSFQDQIQGLFG